MDSSAIMEMPGYNLCASSFRRRMKSMASRFSQPPYWFGIHSPSKVFRDEIGRMLALGVGEGFADEMKAVRDDMQDEIPTDFSTEVNTAFGAANGFTGDVFDVTIPFMIGAEKITTQVSRIQYNRQTGQARVLGVTTA